MKTHFGIAILSALVTTASVLASEAVDFRAVNPVLQSLVDTVIAADDTVEFAYPKFDEADSNLQAERLKYDLTASIKNTAWLTGGHAEITGTSTYAADVSAAHRGIDVTMNVTSHTDTLALIRYSARIALKKRQHVDPQFDERTDAHLHRLAVAQTISEVYELLKSAHQLARDEVMGEVAHQTAWVACLQSWGCATGYDPQSVSTMIESAKDHLIEWQNIQAQIDKIEIRRSTDTYGRDQLSVSSGSVSRMVSGSYPLQVGRTELTFANDSVKMDNESFYNMSQKALEQLKNDFQTHLLGAQRGEKHSLDYIQSDFRFALAEFKRAIRAEIFK